MTLVGDYEHLKPFKFCLNLKSSPASGEGEKVNVGRTYDEQGSLY